MQLCFVLALPLDNTSKLYLKVLICMKIKDKNSFVHFQFLLYLT